jgi:hypothetical protein
MDTSFRQRSSKLGMPAGSLIHIGEKRWIKLKSTKQYQKKYGKKIYSCRNWRVTLGHF